MENTFNTNIDMTLSKEVVSVMINNSLQEAVNNNSTTIKQDYVDIPHSASVEDKTDIPPIIKIKPEWDHFEKMKVESNREYVFDCPYTITGPALDDRSRGKQELIESENSERENEKADETNINEWEFKHETLNIKEEALEQTEISVSSNCLNFHAQQCSYQTTEKRNYKNNFIEDIRPVNIIIFTCDLCNFQTIYKGHFKRHQRIHKNLEETEMLKCDQCGYRAIQRGNLKRHLLIHKNSEEVDKFKCDQCEYQSVRQGDLKRHVLQHKNPKEVNMFKCDQCDYQTFRKDDIKKHLPQHKNPKEVEMFKCEQCVYQTFRKGHLKRHLRQHKDINEVNVFKCNQCGHQTTRKDNLRKHVLRYHKSPKKAKISLN